MSDDSALRRAARANDADAEGKGLTGVLADLGLPVGEVVHVARQRALRAHLLQSGRDDELAALRDGAAVALSDEDETVIVALTAVYIDGIVLGYRAGGETSGGASVPDASHRGRAVG